MSSGLMFPFQSRRSSYLGISMLVKKCRANYCRPTGSELKASGEKKSWMLKYERGYFEGAVRCSALSKV